MAFRTLISESELYTLAVNSEVNHKNFGLCVVESIIPEMGVVLKPTSYNGKALKEMADAKLKTSYTREVPLVEDDFNNISIRINVTNSKMGSATKMA